MSLDWTVKQETARGKYWEASYDAYDTPAGPAVATAKVGPNVYFAGQESDYETWLHDPYLEQAGCRYYVKFAYGSKIGGDHEADAKAACEDYGMREARRGLGNMDVLFLYRDAFPTLAARFLEGRGMSVEELVTTGPCRAQARVLEGGYEPARVELWLGEGMQVEMGYK